MTDAAHTETDYSHLPTPPQSPISAAHGPDDTGSSEPPKPQVRLTDLEVDNEITALNVMVQFLGLAQKRGAFTIDEAAKNWECVKKYQKPQDGATA